MAELKFLCSSISDSPWISACEIYLHPSTTVTTCYGPELYLISPLSYIVETHQRDVVEAKPVSVVSMAT